jgi:dienelactone hydrolase
MRRVVIQCEGASLNGDLAIPRHPKGLVIFAHGSGSGRFSPRNRYIAKVLNEAGLATLLVDLLTEQEEVLDSRTAELRFDIRLLANRLLDCAKWQQRSVYTKHLPVGYFGASTGAAAALIAAAQRPERVFAVVSRGGRPDLAKDWLPQVQAPTLLIVGGDDTEVLLLNEKAERLIRAQCDLKIVPGASHLFEERGALEEVGRMAADWFMEHAAALKGGHEYQGHEVSRGA